MLDILGIFFVVLRKVVHKYELYNGPEVCVSVHWYAVHWTLIQQEGSGIVAVGLTIRLLSC